MASKREKIAQTAASVAKKATTRAIEFARNHCTVAISGPDEYRHAADLAGDDALKLRAGDALHLAIAGHLNVESILGLDEDMLESARALGLKTLTFY